MTFEPGQSGNPAGRKKGSKNKNTIAALQNVHDVYTALGGTEAMVAWAEDNKNDFYTKVWPKILPKNVTIDGEIDHTGLTIKMHDGKTIQVGESQDSSE